MGIHHSSSELCVVLCVVVEITVKQRGRGEGEEKGMAAALECWSSRTSTDTDDMVEQVLMRSNHRSESEAHCSPPPDKIKDKEKEKEKEKEPAQKPKRLQRLGRNVSEAIASLKNSLNINIDSPDGCRKVFWGSVVRSLTQLYPGSQLPDKLVSNIRKHYDSLPLSYAQAGFDLKQVFLHIKLMEEASLGDCPATLIQPQPQEDSLFKLTFACNSSFSWPSMSASLADASISCKSTQIFEKKGFTLGVVLLQLQLHPHQTPSKSWLDSALRLAMKKPKPTTVKLPFGLCGCQEEASSTRDSAHLEEDMIMDEHSCRDDLIPLPYSSYTVSVDEWQTIQSGADTLDKWLLNTDHLDFLDQIGPNSYQGVYWGRKVRIDKLKGCDKGNSYDFRLRKDLLQLMSCGHRNILQFIGVCIDESHGLCVVTKFMEGGSVQELMLKNKKLHFKQIMRISIDVAEGLRFMNDRSVSFRDLNTARIWLDRHGNACLSDIGIVSACKNAGETTEYETDGYRWLAPEIIAGDPECVSETWMSNVYSFGMVMWEMVAGEAAYMAYSPVQAAVGIAACGLRPDIPKDCPQVLRTLMNKCWSSCPIKRPNFSEILGVLLQYGNANGNR